MTFGAAESDVPFGRYTTSTGAVEFTAMSGPTKLTAHAAPKVGPIVINELMYAPTPGGGRAEYLELRNVTGAAVPLFDPLNPANTWKFTAGLDFTFPSGVSLPANGYALIVGTDQATLVAFWMAWPRPSAP